MLKNIISELADNPAVDKELIKPLNALLRKEQFWQTTEKGLAIFVSQNIFDYLALNRTFKKRLTVSKEFDLSGLPDWLCHEAKHYLLAFSPKKVRLFYSENLETKEIKSKVLPKNRQQALNIDNQEKSVQHHSLHSDETFFHGHGANKDYKTVSTREFVKKLDNSVNKLIKDKKVPLVLACTKDLCLTFKAHSTYSNISGKYIPGNPDEKTKKQLTKQAFNVLTS